MTREQVKIVRWIFAVFLILSLVFLLFPYSYDAHGQPVNFIKLTTEVIDSHNITIFFIYSKGIIIGYLIPVILTATSGFIMAYKTSKDRCITCIVLNACALALYVFFRIPFMNIHWGHMGYGYIGNVVISSIGVLLPVIEYALYMNAIKIEKSMAVARE